MNAGHICSTNFMKLTRLSSCASSSSILSMMDRISLCSSGGRLDMFGSEARIAWASNYTAPTDKSVSV